MISAIPFISLIFLPLNVTVPIDGNVHFPANVVRKVVLPAPLKIINEASFLRTCRFEGNRNVLILVIIINCLQ